MQRTRRTVTRRRKAALPIQAALLVGLVLAAVAGSLSFGPALRTQRQLASNDAASMTPPNIFTTEQMESGAVLLFILLMIYMFYGIAIICDDYFVASLELITERLNLSDDVAGATFMAAGGSAPEFATSLLGVFIFESDVGFGTIVGSAVFNILAVIGLCAYFSGCTYLQLTWYPLLRDSSYYLICLGTLVGLVSDREVEWYDSLILVVLYGGYLLIMKFDAQIKAAITYFESEKIGISAEGRRMSAARRSSASVHPTPPLEPIAEAEGDGKHQAATDCGDDSSMEPHSLPSSRRPSAPAADATPTSYAAKDAEDPRGPTADPTVGASKGGDDDDDDDDAPTSQLPSIPEGSLGRLKFAIAAPLLYSFALTVPDCRLATFKRWYLVTFTMSIVWIALLTYVMVWMAEEICHTIRLPVPVMSVTVLAAGTSIPDAISSVLVARKGHGDMALSSSIGSNVFDVTFGLPVPWLLATLVVRPMSVVRVHSASLHLQVATLMVMVVAVIGSIHCFKWRISKPLGVAFFLLYVLFLAEAICLELNVFSL